jgi:hypothetical protein
MNVARRTPSEIADEPTIRDSSWNQTISYMRAAQPLATKRRTSHGKWRSAGEVDTGVAIASDMVAFS